MVSKSLNSPAAIRAYEDVAPKQPEPCQFCADVDYSNDDQAVLIGALVLLVGYVGFLLWSLT